MPRPQRDSLIVAVAAGLVLGVATRFVYELPHEWHWLAKVGVPWLAAAFAVGALARRPARGARNGAAALVAATLVYYAILALVQHAYGVSAVGMGWLLVAVPGGAAFGALGTTYAHARGRARVLAASLLTAAFAGEAVLFALLVHHPGRAGTYLLAIAMALPFLLLRRARERLLALTISAFLAGVALVAEGGVFVVTRYMV